MNERRGSVRIGPISLLTLIIVLCLAVMAVLAVTTSQATYAVAARQASFTEDTYENEASAQKFVAALDGFLARERYAKSSQSEAMASLERELPNLAVQAVDGDTKAAASIDEATVSASFTSPSGRTLDIELGINARLEYSIEQWKATTPSTSEGASETLWTGTE